MSRLLRALRNPYLLVGQGFAFGALIVFATQEGRQAVAAPVPAAIAAPAR